MTPEQQAAIQVWVEREQRALADAEEAMRKVRFCQQIIDRLMLEADFVITPHLYVVE